MHVTHLFVTNIVVVWTVEFDGQAVNYIVRACVRVCVCTRMCLAVYFLVVGLTTYCLFQACGGDQAFQQEYNLFTLSSFSFCTRHLEGTKQFLVHNPATTNITHYTIKTGLGMLEEYTRLWK